MKIIEKMAHDWSIERACLNVIENELTEAA